MYSEAGWLEIDANYWRINRFRRQTERPERGGNEYCIFDRFFFSSCSHVSISLQSPSTRQI